MKDLELELQKLGLRPVLKPVEAMAQLVALMEWLLCPCMSEEMVKLNLSLSLN
jgi:hypothetical protein